jgi:hypothetical protein
MRNHPMDWLGAYAKGQGAPTDEMVQLRVRNAELEAELKALRPQLDDIKAERDRWAQQADLLAIAPPQRKWRWWR